MGDKLSADLPREGHPVKMTPSETSGKHAASTPSEPATVDVPDLSSGDADDSDSEYVYDVYYRDPAPAVASTRTSSVAGTPSFSTSGSSPLNIQELYGYDVGSEAGLSRIGALTGLEDDELLAGTAGDGQENDSDSDMVNTDDEDSNEEDFYRNDYPEGEDDEDDDEIISSADEEDGDDDYRNA